MIDIPDEVKLNEKQKIQVECHKHNKTYIDKKSIDNFLKQLKYPLYFLDFETISPAIPIYDNTSPFQIIPFQYSLHIIEQEGADPVHHSYIAPGDADPRPEILKRLKDLLGDVGSILAYNMSFEKNCLKNASETYTEFKKWYGEIDNRFIDLLIPFRKFYYYNPKQCGSASLKKVLPALTDNSYENMEISDGGMASNEYYRIMLDKTVSEEERKRVQTALEKYCSQDTKGMIDILTALRQL
jgi:hypothetical protein